MPALCDITSSAYHNGMAQTAAVQTLATALDISGN